MTRSEIRDFIKSGVDALNKSIPFNSGRISEFNSQRSNEYPYVWLDSLSVVPNFSTTGPPMDDWGIVLHIAKQDKIDSKAEEYESIVDDCDLIAQELAKTYNDLLEDSNLVVLSGASREPFIKDHADCLTGVIFSFNLNTWDKSSFC